MKHFKFYPILLLPVLFFSYYFFFEKKTVKLNFEPKNLSSNAKKYLFSKENLYDYLNGGAEKIIELGFQYLKVWEIEKENKKYTIELYFFNSKEGPKKLLEIFSKGKIKSFKNSIFEALNDQGIALKGNYFFKVNTYPEDKNFISEKINDFLEWKYE